MEGTTSVRSHYHEAAHDGHIGSDGSSRVLGYGAKGHTHKQSFWHLSRDPPMIAVIDTEDRLKAAAEVLETIVSRVPYTES